MTNNVCPGTGNVTYGYDKDPGEAGSPGAGGSPGPGGGPGPGGYSQGAPGDSGMAGADNGQWNYTGPSNCGSSAGGGDPCAIFSQLRIWVDSNHNGLSEPGELHTLTEVGITAISLSYSYSFRRDQFGNQFRYFARVFDAR